MGKYFVTLNLDLGVHQIEIKPKYNPQYYHFMSKTAIFSS